MFTSAMKSKNVWAYLMGATLVLSACNQQNVTPPSSDKIADAMPKSAKRGVAFNFSVMEDLPLLSDAISWDYNWGNDQNSTAAAWMDMEGIEFCPMCWSGNYNADRIRAYVAVHPSTKYLLAFNEPNLKDQARMTPAQAAALWAPVVALAKELKLKLVSPAMNYGTLDGYNDPIKWLDEFFAQPGVSVDDVDAISIHCYMASPQAVKNYIALFEKYGKPIWLTEFCAWEEYSIHSEADQISYMCSMLNHLEQNPKVERYAWFIPRYKSGFPYMPLLTYSAPYELTDAGKVYCGFSSFDSSVWLRANERVNVAHYIAVSSDELQVRPSTDGDGLMLSTIREKQFVDYQIYAPTDASSIAIRYAAYGKTDLAIWVDGDPIAITSLAATGNMNEWATAEVPMALSQGKHTLRLEVQSGVANIYWFQIK